MMMYNTFMLKNKFVSFVFFIAVTYLGNKSNKPIIFDINSDFDGSVVSFTRPSFGDEENGELQFRLSVNDGEESSLFDTLTVKFGRPSRPITPVLSTRTEHQTVILRFL